MYKVHTSNFGIALSLDLVEDVKTVLNELGLLCELVTLFVSSYPTIRTRGKKVPSAMLAAHLKTSILSALGRLLFGGLCLAFLGTDREV